MFTKQFVPVLLIFMLCAAGIAHANVQAPAGSPRFLTLPFNDPAVVVRQGWYYDVPGRLTCPRAAGDIGSGRTHCGIDYFKGVAGARVGFDVVAAAPGRARWFPNVRSAGNYIVIVHDEYVSGRRFCTRYLHLASRSGNINAQGWTRVDRGTIIGQAGDTDGGAGIVDGIHLHFEVLTFTSTTEVDFCNPPEHPRYDPYDIAEGLMSRGIEPTYIHYPGRETNNSTAGVPVQPCGPNSLWRECPAEPPTIVATGNACTQRFDSSDSSMPVPTGYGAAYNLFSPRRELVVQGVCDETDNVQLVVGSSLPTQWIFNQAHYFDFDGGGWRPVRLTGNDQRGQWIIGRATGNFTRTRLQLSNDNFVVAYVCNLVNREWKCGCSNTACGVSSWQLQAIKRR